MEKYPDQQLNTAFQAYMKNPNAANQVVQATAKGAPTGLQGLAAAAAAHQFQTDQQAQQQQQMMQQQAQGQPPSIVQQLAMQTSQMPGIMGQLGPSMDLAGAPSSPAPQMQQMAGGGLVAFADGGMVLPPDVLEAIQSHFAQGGEIRGFPVGGHVETDDDILRKVFSGGREPRNFAQSERMKDIRASNMDRPTSTEIEDIRRRIVGGPPADVEMPTYGQRGVQSQITPPGELPGPSPDADLNAVRQQNYLRQVTGNDPGEYPTYGQRATRSTFTPTEGVPAPSPDADLSSAIREHYMRQVTGNAPGPSSYMKRMQTVLNEGTPKPTMGESLTPYSSKLPPEPPVPNKMITGLSESAARALPEIPSDWTHTAPGESFNWGRVGELASKLPEGVKNAGLTTGRAAETVLRELGPAALALDPRVQAAAKLSTGAARGSARDILEGMGQLNSSDSSLQGLDALVHSGLNPELGDRIAKMLGLASGGEVRGFSGGMDIQSLLGQTESPGMALVRKAKEAWSHFNEPSSAPAAPAAPATPAPTPRTSTPEQDQADLSRMLGERPRSGMSRNNSDFPEPKTYNAATPPGSPPATPKQEVHEEAQKTDPAFDQAKHDMPTTSTAPANSGLGGLFGDNMDLGQVRDYITELRGHQTMDPEIAQQLADLKGDAQTNTIVQSLLGGLGAGLSSPYGGRFALGKAALGALSGFEQGSKGEEDLGQKAFNVLKGYKDAPALEQQKATDFMLGQLGDTAKLQSQERIAESRDPFMAYQYALAKQHDAQQFRIDHPELFPGYFGPQGIITPQLAAQHREQAREDAKKWADGQQMGNPDRKFIRPSEAEIRNKEEEFYRGTVGLSSVGSGNMPNQGAPLLIHRTQ